jgi:hypothetical protein
MGSEEAARGKRLQKTPKPAKLKATDTQPRKRRTLPKNKQKKA